jgi:hypothetical protein
MKRCLAVLRENRMLLSGVSSRPGFSPEVFKRLNRRISQPSVIPRGLILTDEVTAALKHASDANGRTDESRSGGRRLNVSSRSSARFCPAEIR